MAPRKTPAGPAPRSPPRSAHVVGDAAAAGAATGTDTTPSSDWLEELRQPAVPTPGVAISTRAGGGLHRGRVTESKRGQR